MVRSVAKVNVWYGNNDNNDEYSGITYDNKPPASSSTYKNNKNGNNNTFNNYGKQNGVNGLTNSLKKSEYKSFGTNGKLSNENEYEDDKEDKKLFDWPKNNAQKVSNGETISLDVDDERIVGILVWINIEI